MTTPAVPVDTFTASDWWTLRAIDEDHLDPTSWGAFLHLTVAFPTEAEPIDCLSLTATDKDPVPVLDINYSELTASDLDALAPVLQRVARVIRQIAHDIYFTSPTAQQLAGTNHTKEN